MRTLTQKLRMYHFVLKFNNSVVPQLLNSLLKITVMSVLLHVVDGLKAKRYDTASSSETEFKSLIVSLMYRGWLGYVSPCALRLVFIKLTV